MNKEIIELSSIWSDLGKFGLTRVRQNVHLKSWTKVAERGPSHLITLQHV